MNTKHLQHLFWRAGFGIAPDRLEVLGNRSKREVVNQLFLDSKQISPLSIDLSEFESLDPMVLIKDPKKLRQFVNRSLQRIKDFNYAWVNRMINTDEVLREHMVLFWANHFVCRDSNVRFMQQFNNTLREHALGHFGDFVKAISKEPAMLKYLNNKQNVKRNPNENFARELMELFTLGAGNYSEKDIKESARAFTGYFHDFDGKFILRPLRHDHEMKRFFSKKGQFNGDDIIDIIISERQCAKFICEKIYRYFVNDMINDDHIIKMIAVFYPSYDISELMRYIFMSDWFYDDINIGVKIKSPIEFLVGINAAVPITFNNKLQLIALQKLLGQVLLDPPNVAGWKGGKSWINSNTILLRLKLPSLLLNGGFISMKMKGDFIDPLSGMIRDKLKEQNRFNIKPDWEIFKSRFDAISREQMLAQLIVSPISDGTNQLLNDLGKSSKKDYLIQLMSLPEYQMC